MDGAQSIGQLWNYEGKKGRVVDKQRWVEVTSKHINLLRKTRRRLALETLEKRVVEIFGFETGLGVPIG